MARTKRVTKTTSKKNVNEEAKISKEVASVTRELISLTAIIQRKGLEALIKITADKGTEVSAKCPEFELSSDSPLRYAFQAGPAAQTVYVFFNDARKTMRVRVAGQAVTELPAGSSSDPGGDYIRMRSAPSSGSFVFIRDPNTGVWEATKAGLYVYMKKGSYSSRELKNRRLGKRDVTAMDDYYKTVYRSLPNRQPVAEETTAVEETGKAIDEPVPTQKINKNAVLQIPWTLCVNPAFQWFIDTFCDRASVVDGEGALCKRSDTVGFTINEEHLPAFSDILVSSSAAYMVMMSSESVRHVWFKKIDHDEYRKNYYKFFKENEHARQCILITSRAGDTDYKVVDVRTPSAATKNVSGKKEAEYPRAGTLVGAPTAPPVESKWEEVRPFLRLPFLAFSNEQSAVLSNNDGLVWADNGVHGKPGVFELEGLDEPVFVTFRSGHIYGLDETSAMAKQLLDALNVQLYRYSAARLNFTSISYRGPMGALMPTLVIQSDNIWEDFLVKGLVRPCIM